MTTASLMVTTTVASADEAQRLARALVEARLAACVQTLPIHSTYRWNDAVETASELLLICKVRAADYDAVEAMIRVKSGYEVPEVVAVSIAAGSADYLNWLVQSTVR